MRVLLLAPFDLFPPVHGGSSIVYSFVKHASARHDVTALISHLYSLGGPVDLAGNVQVHYCRRSPFDRLKVLSFLVNPYYYWAAERLCRERSPDVIQCEILWPMLVGSHLRRKHRVPLVWIEHNIEAQKFAELGRPGLVTSLVRIVERLACKHADHIVTLTDLDRNHLIELYGAKPERITVINPGPDLDDFRFDAESRAAVRGRYGLSEGDVLLTFVGNLEYEPNAQAVRRIAHDIYPAIIRDHPTARFAIIGQGQERLSDCRLDRITFAGYVTRQDLIAHLSATDIFVVPIETGSGIRVKIPEATACGRAVVATRKAAEGLECFGEDELVRVASAGHQFVSAVLRLVDDRNLRDAIGERAEARTRHEFGWEKTLEKYETVYSKATTAARESGF